MKFFRYLSPTALCEAQEAVHRDRPAGDAAAAAARVLRKFWPALAVVPRGNIAIRQLLTLAGLTAEREERAAVLRKTDAALTMLRRGCRGAAREPLPYIEGWSYLQYTRAPYEYLRKVFYAGSLLPAEFQAQEQLAAVRALPTGEVPDTDTRLEERVRPDTREFYTCQAFTVWRRPGKFLLVWHDVRVRAWPWRFNLHVENTFGLEVRKAEDWPYWYTGWPNKKVSIWWRFWAPRMRVIARGPGGVILQVGSERRVIRP